MPFFSEILVVGKIIWPLFSEKFNDEKSTSFDVLMTGRITLRSIRVPIFPLNNFMTCLCFAPTRDLLPTWVTISCDFSPALYAGVSS